MEPSKETKEAAEKGDHGAALKLYIHYTQVEPNEKEAAYWLKLAGGGRMAGTATTAPPPAKTVELNSPPTAEKSNLLDKAKDRTGEFAEKAKNFGSEGLQKLRGAAESVRSKTIGAEKEKKPKVFGVPLDRNSKEVPIVLAKVLEYFELKGVRHEGLFRLSGSMNVMQALKERFDSGETPDLSVVQDVHIVSGLLKLWFRELPEPLLTYELYDAFIAAASIPVLEGTLTASKSALRALPPCNYLTLKYLVAFLDEVQRESDVNKMGPPNLALIFAPNLLRPHTTDNADFVAMMQDSPYANRMLELFVIHYEELFERTTSNPEFAHPTPEPTTSVAFRWRPSQQPTDASPLAGHAPPPAPAPAPSKPAAAAAEPSRALSPRRPAPPAGASASASASASTYNAYSAVAAALQQQQRPQTAAFSPPAAPAASTAPPASQPAAAGPVIQQAVVISTAPPTNTAAALAPRAKAAATSASVMQSSYSPAGLCTVRALYDFPGAAPGDLRFKKGDVITVWRMLDPGWWEGEVHGVIGLFPVPYVEKMGAPQPRPQPPQEAAAPSPKRPQWGINEVKEHKKQERKENLKIVLDTTAEKRAEDTARKQQEDAEAERAIAEEEAELEKQRLLQEEQERRKQRAEQVALRFSMFMRKLQGVPEEVLLKELEDADASARAEQEALAKAKRELEAEGRTTPGEKSIIEGGRPKKLRYFAKFDKTTGPQTRKPRQGGMRDHLKKIESRNNRNRAQQQILANAKRVREAAKQAAERKQTEARALSASTGSVRASAALPKAKPAPLHQPSTFSSLLGQFQAAGSEPVATGETEEAVTALDELLLSWGLNDATPSRRTAKPNQLPPLPPRSSVRASVSPRQAAAQGLSRNSDAGAARSSRSVRSPSPSPTTTPAATPAPGQPAGTPAKPPAAGRGHRKSASSGSIPALPRPAPAPAAASPEIVSPQRHSVLKGSASASSLKKPAAKPSSPSPSRPVAGAAPVSPSPSGLKKTAPKPKPAPLHEPSTFTSLVNQLATTNSAPQPAAGADTDEAVSALDDLLEDTRPRPAPKH